VQFLTLIVHVHHGLDLEFCTSFISLTFPIIKFLSLLTPFHMNVIFALFETLEAEIAERFVHRDQVLLIRAFAFIFPCKRKYFVTFACLAVVWTIFYGFHRFWGANLRRLQDFPFLQFCVTTGTFDHRIIILL
jgi:hypothetical protein